MLELAIGTGRIALPLAARGLEVHGIDASPRMVERLRAKPGGAAIPVTIGDFAEVTAESTYSLVFVAFNTLFALTTQERQVRCFANVAERLGPGGRFVIEVFVPDVTRFDRGQRFAATAVEHDGIRIEASRHDPVAQTIETQEIDLGTSSIRLQPIHIRYAWPAELDLMGRLAGLRLQERWGGWRREPFTAASKQHVSIYEPR